jgi:ABC-2 type transport system ATP-binding protein
MISILGQIRDSGHTRLLMSSHLLPDVEACCDEVLILREGRLAEHADLDRERRTNRKFLNVEVLGDDRRFLESVRSAGCEVTPVGPSMLRLVLPGDMAIPEVYRMAAEAEATIGRLSYKRDSLEDIFLEAMGPDRGHP